MIVGQVSKVVLFNEISLSCKKLYIISTRCSHWGYNRLMTHLKPYDKTLLHSM